MMKRMTRLKLINWHYLVDSTIEFNGSCLITGDNGAGKSTVLDAIQYVLTCGKGKFNSAANEKTKRDLMGYVRCKTGNDSNIYERRGDVTSHVVLEFYEEKKKRYFIIGAVIDSAGDLSAPKSVFYRVENTKITDEFYLNQDKPRNINDFKVRIKTLDSKIFSTRIAAQNDFMHRFGAIGPRFFELLPKALAFRPINNVKDFVYSYILDEKEVNIQYLKENVRTYMEFDKVLKEIKEKLGRLNEIIDKYSEVERIEENIKIHYYIVLRSRKEMYESELKAQKIAKDNLKLLFAEGERKSLEIQREIQSKRALESEIHTSMLTHKTYRLMDRLKNELGSLRIEEQKLSNAERKLDQEIQLVLGRAKSLRKRNYELNGLKEFFSLSVELQNGEMVTEFVKTVGIAEESCYGIRNKTTEEKLKFSMEKKDIEERLAEIEREIKRLENKQLSYDEHIIRLKDAIMAEIKAQSGKEVEPRIVCELLQIKDDTWKDAVEGYLNTQRFNLIVEPEYFDISINTYERIKRKKNIHGVGLINTGKLEAFKECSEESLAYVVSSKNKYAEYYINMILGKVVRCKDVNELKKHSCSITPTCMVYQNNTARQINPSVYAKPYIGADAYQKQLEMKLKEKSESLERWTLLSEELNKANEIINLLSNIKWEYIKENASLKVENKRLGDEIADKERQLAEIDQSTIISLKMQLDEICKERAELEKRLNQIIKEVARYDVEIENCEKEILNKDKELKESAFCLKEFAEKNVDILAKAQERYADSFKSKSLEMINNNFSRSRAGFSKQLENRINELKQLQWNYNKDFHFGAAEGSEGMGAFYQEHQNLKESKIIEYEEKIKEAREKAEEEFKEHFLAKLQENIVSAQNEFKKLNDALKEIKFGDDEYKFQCIASKEYKKFYEMIMDDSNFSGFTLFTGKYRDKHREAMDELFERITIDDENSRKTLEKFTDYRTFMDYDIKIFHSNGKTSTFSKVCREKSGGETQTPYYVAIAASFVQLYGSALHDETPGLILFDEAFDKMDENRIDSMMQFLNKLNLQVVLASPPQKVESIAPHVGTTLVVFKEDKFSFVEALYKNEKVQ